MPNNLGGNVSIPPNSEVLTIGNVIPPVFEKIQSIGIIETSDRLLKSDRGLVARALIKGNTIT